MPTDIDMSLESRPKSKTAAEMRANVLRQYPLLGMEFTLDDRITTYFPVVNK